MMSLQSKPTNRYRSKGMGDKDFSLKNITVGIVFTPFNWQLKAEWIRAARLGTLSVGPFMITGELP